MKYGLDIHLYSSAVDKIDFYLKDVFSLFSDVLDYLVPGVRVHHSAVALISFDIALQMGLSNDEIELVTNASLIHDIGLGGLAKRFDSIEGMELDYEHCRVGYEMLKKIPWAGRHAEIVLHHHDKWIGDNKSGAKKDTIPLESRIIFLANEVAMQVYTGSPYTLLNMKDAVLRRVRDLKGTYFDPDVVGAFEKVAQREAFWFSLNPVVVKELVKSSIPGGKRVFSTPDIIRTYTVLADIVDFKSQFTRNHSINVARLAALLACKMHFSEFDIDMTMLGGLLHDIGKVAVPSYVLDKPGRLTKEEFNIMKLHPYVTHTILASAPSFGFVDMIASLHHEKLNGSGYPFRLTKRHLSLGARLMAVADIFSALHERRPYRRNFGFAEIMNIMLDMVAKGEIDADIVDVLVANKDEAIGIINEDLSRRFDWFT